MYKSRKLTQSKSQLKIQKSKVQIQDPETDQDRAIDPDKEKLKKERFRRLARKILMVRFWSLEQYEKKTAGAYPKIAGILTEADKEIIRKHPSLRTSEERKALVKLVANLTVFATLPPKIRARTTAYIYFLSVDIGHRIIRQGRKPVTVYFILTGDVEVSSLSYPQGAKHAVHTVEYLCGPGDWIGEIDFLENTNRKYTFTAMSEVELLGIDGEEFELTIMPFLKRYWEEKKAAIRFFPYFDFLTNDQIILACQLGLLQQFEPYEDILSEDKGVASYAHFVISGQCMILQCLKMTIKNKDGTKSFKLKEVKEGADLLKDLNHMELRSFLRRETIKSLADSHKSIEEDIQSVIGESERKDYMIDFDAIERNCAHIRERLSKKQTRMSQQRARFSKRFTKTDSQDRISFKGESFEGEFESEFESNFWESDDLDDSSSSYLLPNFARISIKKEVSTDSSEPSRELIEDDVWTSSSASTYESSSSSDYKIRPSTIRYSFKPKEVSEQRFIDVGRISQGGIFGLGERMEHRIIMAETTVQCLKLPRYWLLERDQNPTNIWQRLRRQLDLSLPSREMLFQDFLATRKWQTFKSNYIKSQLVDFKAHASKPEDIPAMWRILSPDN